MEQLPTILGALVLAAVLWVVKATTENTTALKVLQITMSTIEKTVDLVIQPETVQIREIAQKAVHNTELLSQRTAGIERDIKMLWEDSERRSGRERRSDSNNKDAS